MPDEQPNRPIGNQVDTLGETRTSIDTLLELLRSRGKSELSSIAISLNIDPRILENWAKVLEAGNLIKIDYQVGKMYLEPVNLTKEAQSDLKTKTDLNKFLLEEDLAIEKISIDKFSKNIDELNVTIAGIEKMYQQKMPDVHKILAEVENAYAPVEQKKKSALKVKEDTEKDYSQMIKKINELYAKLNAFSPKNVESDMTSKFEKLNTVLASVDSAQNMISDMDKSKSKLFATIENDMAVQIKEFRHQLNDSKSNIEKSVRSNSRQLNDLIKSIKDQVNAAKQVSKEVGNFRKEFESTKHNLDSLSIKFSDKYQKIMDGMTNDMKLVNEQSKRVEDSINTIRLSMGEVSKFDEAIHNWKRDMSEMTKEVALTKTEILKLTNQLNMIESNKSINLEKRAQMTEELTKQSKSTKERVGKIKKVIKDTADDIKGHIETK